MVVDDSLRDDAASMSDRQPHGRRKMLAMTLAVAVTVAGLGVGGVALAGTADESAAVEGSGEADTAPATSSGTEEVARRNLIEQRTTAGTVTFGESWALPIRASGVVTDAPEAGTVVNPGQVLLHVNALPVYLAEGSVPLYRELRLQTKALSGEDVAQLQRFLMAAGFDDEGRLTADGEFGRTTRNAVRAWQKANGLEVTGAIDRTQIVFSEAPVRIAKAPRVGDDFNELAVTAAGATITTEIQTDDRSFAEVGTPVTLDAGNGSELTGRITKVTPTVNDGGDRRLSVTIEPNQQLDAALTRVQVTLTKTVATDVLTVPVRAVVALSGGGFALEVVRSTGPALRQVELGAVTDDLVEVSGDIAEGDRVIVPSLIGGES